VREIEVLDTFQGHYWEVFMAPTLLDRDQKASVRAGEGASLPASERKSSCCALLTHASEWK